MAELGAKLKARDPNVVPNQTAKSDVTTMARQVTFNNVTGVSGVKVDKSELDARLEKIAQSAKKKP